MKESDKIFLPACDWCGDQEAEHEGGFELENFSQSGHFCDEKCFKKWVMWNSALIKIKVPVETKGCAN